MTIINLTQHAATPAQKAAGVVDVHNRDALTRLLTVQVSGEYGFSSLSKEGQKVVLDMRVGQILSEFVFPAVTAEQRQYLASIYAAGQNDYHVDPDAWAAGLSLTELSQLGKPTVKAMIGGFAPLVANLTERLKGIGVRPVVALSDRVSKEEALSDGSVRKTQAFVHCGFYEL